LTASLREVLTANDGGFVKVLTRRLDECLASLDDAKRFDCDLLLRRAIARIFHHVVRVSGCFLVLAASDFVFSSWNIDRYAIAENTHRPCQAKKSPRRELQCVPFASGENSCNDS